LIESVYYSEKTTYPNLATARKELLSMLGQDELSVREVPPQNFAYLGLDARLTAVSTVDVALSRAASKVEATLDSTTLSEVLEMAAATPSTAPLAASTNAPLIFF
jgi:hypothetical protein